MRFLKLSLLLCKLGSWNLDKHWNALQLEGGMYKLDSLALHAADYG